MGALTAVSLAFVLSATAIAAFVSVRQGATPGETIRIVAASLASLSLLGSLTSAITALGIRRVRGGLSDQARAVRMARLVALLAGVVASTVLVVVLGIRLVYFTVDLVTVLPGGGGRDYGYGLAGLLCLALLFVSCGVSLASTRDPQLITCQFLITVLAAVWASLLAEVYRITPSGGLQQTGAALALPSVLSVLLVVAVLIRHRIRRRPDPVTADADDSATLADDWPGFRTVCGVMALGMILLTCYHLSVPIAPPRGGFRIVAVVAMLSAAAAAWGCFLLVAQQWSGRIADAGMGLASLALCGAAESLLPSRPISLAERYPMIFNVLIIALASAVALCTWMATMERRGTGRAGRMAERLVTHAKRFAFLNAVLALALGGLMAVWPHIRWIAIPDASVGRVTAGFGANLFLLLVLLWCSRRLRRLTFHVLTILALVSAAGFMIMRMYPFTPQFG